MYFWFRGAALCALASLALYMSLPSSAADGPFPREAAAGGPFPSEVESTPGKGAAAQSAEKRAPGCDVSVEIGEHHKRVTDRATGKSYILKYFEDGRVSNFDTDTASFSVLYANERPLAVVESVSGRVFMIYSGKGADWYANLRLQGKFPSAEKLIEHICSPKQEKLTVAEGDLPTDMMTTDYWDAEFSGSDWALNWAGASPTVECLGNLISCFGACDDRSDIQQTSCAIIGGIWTEIAGPVGIVIGAVCSISSTNQKQQCHAQCQADNPC